MKYDLTIRDLTAEQVAEVIGRDAKTTVATVKIDGSEAASQIRSVIADESATIETVNTGEAAAAVEANKLDAMGLPWDERIHAGSKAKNNDGKWKRRKGVQDLQFEAVAEELKKTMQVGTVAIHVDTVETTTPVFPAIATPSVPETPPAPTAPAAAPVVEQPATNLAMPAPVATVEPVPAPVAAPIAPAIERDFSGLMTKISQLMQAKEIDMNYAKTIVDRVNTGFGSSIATLPDVQSDPRMIAYAWQCLEVDKKV